MRDCNISFKLALSKAFRIVDLDFLQFKAEIDACQKHFCSRKGGSISQKSPRHLNELPTLATTNVLNECHQNFNTYLSMVTAMRQSDFLRLLCLQKVACKNGLAIFKRTTMLFPVSTQRLFLHCTNGSHIQKHNMRLDRRCSCLL